MYLMRMARVNITVPDAVIERAREHGLKVSGIATAALEYELMRIDKIAELDKYLAELEAELGPPDEKELRRAKEWGDAVFGPVEADERRTA